MVTVDTVFVRASYRRRGHVTTLLEALSQSHNDIGFSQPISDSMVKGDIFFSELVNICSFVSFAFTQEKFCFSSLEVPHPQQRAQAEFLGDKWSWE